jgi:hypothetical protein
MDDLLRGEWGEHDPLTDIEPVTREHKRRPGSNPVGRPRGPETMLIRIPKALEAQVRKMVEESKAVK